MTWRVAMTWLTALLLTLSGAAAASAARPSALDLRPVSVEAQPVERRALLWTLREYDSELQRVIDGDTYVLRVELGFDTVARATIRLEGLDTPERFTVEGRRATAAALARLQAGRITIVPTGARTFTRWVAHVYVDGASLAAHLRAEGHVKPTDQPVVHLIPGRRPSCCPPLETHFSGSIFGRTVVRSPRAPW